MRVEQSVLGGGKGEKGFVRGGGCWWDGIWMGGREGGWEGGREGGAVAGYCGWVATVHEWVGRFAMFFPCSAMETRKKRTGNGLGCNSSETGGGEEVSTEGKGEDDCRKSKERRKKKKEWNEINS